MGLTAYARNRSDSAGIVAYAFPGLSGCETLRQLHSGSGVATNAFINQQPAATSWLQLFLGVALLSCDPISPLEQLLGRNTESRTEDQAF